MEIKERKKIYIVICVFILFVFSALRSTEYTSDILQYHHNYVKYGNTEWSTLFSLIRTGEGKDPVFNALMKLCYGIGLPYQFFLLLTAAFYFISLGRFIYKYSRDPLLSITIFISLGHYYFSMTGIRQSLAIAFILFAIDYLLQKKIFRFTLFVMLGALLHNSALIAFFIFPLSGIQKVTWKSLLFIPFSAVLTALTGGLLMQKWDTLLGSQYAVFTDSSTVLNFSSAIITALISVYCFVISKNRINKSKDLRLFYLLQVVSILPNFYATFALAEIFRIAYYFDIFTIVLIPGVIEIDYKKPKNKSTTVSRLITYAMFLLYFFSFGGSVKLLSYKWIL